MSATGPTSSASTSKVTSADEAVGLVADGDVVAVCGVVWSMVPEQLLAALERRFLETGAPRNLTEYHLHVYGMGPGTGLEHFAHDEMLTRVIGGSFAPPYWFKDSRINAMIAEDRVEAFIVPAGVISAQWRQAGGGRPGVVSEIGINTFVDPRQLGGRLTESARNSGHVTSEVIELHERDWLYYPVQPIDVSLIRATSADPEGNLTMEEEPVLQDTLAQALATHASGGKVIAQVKRVVEPGTLDPRLVRVPGIVVDAVVEHPEQMMLEYGIGEDNPALVGAYRLPPPPSEPVPDGVEALISHRAIREIEPGQVINLGAGMPVNVVSKVLRETGIADRCTISVEHGSLGGTNLGEFLCQTHWNPTAMMDSGTTLDFYTGGGLDIGFLGAAEIGADGSVNVSMVGDAIAGVGGFMDIAQAARKVVFCTSLTYGGLRASIVDGAVRIDQEGERLKFVGEPKVVSFSGPDALARGQEVLYVTERCVFRLAEGGLELVEVAPGIDVERDIRPYVEAGFREPVR